MHSSPRPAALRRAGFLTAVCLLAEALGGCNIDSGFGGGLLPRFGPAYISIEFPDYARQPCSVAYSLDGAAFVAIVSGRAIETTAGPHTVALEVGGSNPPGCDCVGSTTCQLTARNAEVAVIRLHNQQGALCSCDANACYYHPQVVTECPP